MNRNLILGFLCIVGLGIAEAKAQPPQVVIPNADYYRAYEFLKDGRTEEADAVFRTALRPLNLPIEQRGFESIPSLVMLGETYYHQGHLQMALEQYELALQVLARSSAWIRSLEPLANTDKSDPGKSIAWGISYRKTQPSRTPARWVFTVTPNGVSYHTPTGERALVGAVANVDALEILRVSAIALWRRSQLLGPMAEGIELSQQVEQALASHIGALPPVLQQSLKLCQGLAGLSGNDIEKARLAIEEATSIAGEGDYPLTPIALMASAEWNMDEEQLELAKKKFFDAALVAAYYDQADMVAMAIQNYAMICTAERDTHALTVLPQVQSWAKNRSRLILASCAAGMGSFQVGSQDRTSVPTHLRALKTIIAPRDMIVPRYEALGYWIGARQAFANHSPREGNEALELSLKYSQGDEEDPAGVREFRLQWMLQQQKSGKMAVQRMRRNWSSLLRSPLESEWILRPTETMAWLTMDKTQAMDVWVQSELLQGQPWDVASAVDAKKRSDFLKYDPLGGRWLAVRQLYLQNPALREPSLHAQWSRWHAHLEPVESEIDKVRKLCSRAIQEPYQLDVRSFSETQIGLWDAMATESNRLENTLTYASLANLPCALDTPCEVLPQAWSNRIAEGTVVVGFFESAGTLHGIALSEGKASVWKVGSTIEVQKSIATVLEWIGIKRVSDFQQVEKERLAKALLELRRRLLPKSFQEMLKPRDRIVVVPHAFLWYFPFELLPGDIDGGPSIVVRHPLQYAGTLGLASKESQAMAVRRSLALDAPRYLCEDEGLQSKWMEGIAQASQSKTYALGQAGVRMQPSRWSHLQADRFLILGRNPILDPATIAPFGYDADQEEGLVAGWLKAPMQGPRDLVISGIETGLVRGTLGNGSELFQLACALPASGNQCALLSRWPMRGQSSAMLLQSYFESRAYEPASLAWQRSLLSNWEERFDLASEPNLVGKDIHAANGTMPLLWAGFFQVGDALPPLDTAKAVATPPAEPAKPESEK